MATLALIKYTKKNGNPSTEYGLQESRNGRLLRLYDNEADQIELYGGHEWELVRVLGEVNHPDDFWNLIASCKQIKPVEA